MIIFDRRNYRYFRKGRLWNKSSKYKLFHGLDCWHGEMFCGMYQHGLRELKRFRMAYQEDYII